MLLPGLDVNEALYSGDSGLAMLTSKEKGIRGALYLNCQLYCRFLVKLGSGLLCCLAENSADMTELW